MGDGSIAYVTMREDSVPDELQEDFNGDGQIDDAVVTLLVGDADEDGTFDEFDGCVEQGDASQIDYDNDGLGDFGCDDAAPPCPATPLTNCKVSVVSGKSSLAISDDTSPSKDRFRWLWQRGGATGLDDFMNPLTSGARYSICIYDESPRPQPLLGQAVVGGGSCADKPCWKRTGKNGYQFSDTAGTQGGITRVKVKSGAQGKARVEVRGEGANVSIPDLPATLPVSVQLLVSDGSRTECWATTFNSTTKNDPEDVRAKDE